LRRLGANDTTLNSSSNVRMDAEIEIDELLYQLVGVKDALLQEINCKFNLGLEQRKVELDTINEQLKQEYGEAVAKDITIEIRRMTSYREDPLWLINELHNLSKHRAMIGMAISIVVGGKTSTSLIDPRTGQGMQTNEGKQKPIIEYLEESYTEIEELQKKVRDKISRYLTVILFRQGSSQPVAYLFGGWGW
jgi:hypothetical protein